MKNGKKQEIFDTMNESDAQALKQRLERARLTQAWLMFRLDRDFGISIKKSYLSELLDGKRPLGYKTRRIIWCGIKVMDEYEAYYKGR